MVRQQRGGNPSGSVRSTPLLLAASLLVIVVVAAVMVFGVQHPPAVERLGSDDGETGPSAAIAWLSHDGRDSCLHMAWPDGSTTQPWCDAYGGELIGWNQQTVVVHQWEPAQELHIDAVRGEVVEVHPTEQRTDPTRPAAPVTTYRDGDELVFLLNDDELWRVPAPDAYGLRTSAVSPDDRWVALLDAADRLLVVPSDGTAPPRLWATDVTSWSGLVWQGS